jgi:hypothetical protein
MAALRRLAIYIVSIQGLASATTTTPPTNNSQYFGTIKCGNGAGPQTSNWFVAMECDGNDGAACVDDFNGWCCPQGFKCHGVYHDPGHNTHCMSAPDHVTKSCLCDQTEYEIIAMDPVGEPKIENAWDSRLSACCQYPTSNCGWKSTISRQDSQEVSWSDTTEVGFHMTWNVEAGPAMKLGEIGFQVSNSFTTGQSSTTTTKQQYENGCTCTPNYCTAPFTNLTFNLKVVYSTLEVQIKARKCGVVKTFPGAVKTSQWMGHSECVIRNATGCPGTRARLRGTGEKLIYP